MTKPRSIRLFGVRQNNLKNISVEIPFRELTVVTGLSGSGKSSLVFDTLYAEGQRRYVESLSTYTRQFLAKMPKPELDRIESVPPAIALEQKNHVVNSRSTVGTQTEIVDYLRLLYAKVGRTFCLDCGTEVKKISAETLVEWGTDWLPKKKAYLLAPLGAREGDVPPPKKTKGKKKSSGGKKAPPKSKAKTLGPATLDALFSVIREQGFQRAVYLPKAGAEAVSLDLGELGTPAFLKLPKDAAESGRLFVVVDRLRVTALDDPETRSRLADSIDQGLRLGKGRVAFYDLDSFELKTFDARYACIGCGREYREPEPQLFAFNNPLGACSHCSGFGYTLELDEGLVVPDPSKTLKNGAIDPFSKPSFSDWQSEMFRFAERHGISIGKRYRELTQSERRLLWDGDPSDEKNHDRFPGIRQCFEELKKWKYKLHIRVFIRRYQSQSLCPVCLGSRLQADALAVRVGELNFPKVLELPIIDSLAWIRSLKLTAAQKKIATEIFQQVERRLSFLEEVGVGYLTLARLAKTLSGGEFQRINLATQIGNGLCGTLYILDEPSIGLHAADTSRLIRVLERLRDQGNTVVVVEHDLEVMKSANYLIELGPGAGRRGGELVIQGTPAEVIACKASVTGKYLSGATRLERDRPMRPAPRRAIKITGCRENNLKNIDVEFPLDRFVVVTGVSGSGKSTLVHKTFYQALSQLFYRTPEAPGKFDRLYGADLISGVVMLDQSPIGKSSRSNPATYLKAWDEVRRLYANQSLSLRRGYAPQHFSFNVDGGRCPVCKGEGEITLDMHFMAEVKLPCEECDGKRFKRAVLDVTYKGKDVYQLLETTIDDAYEMFRDNPILSRKFGILREVGLGYLHVGQSATTLSGGESQRLKIAATLDERDKENLLYVFDEPTTGLHLDDVKKLLTVVQDLIDARHSVVMIEHHMDVIAQADWVIDLGPGGGIDGGDLVAAAPPDRLLVEPKSQTGRMLLEQGYVFPAREGREPETGLRAR